MKKDFIEKFHDYCWSRDLKDEIFKTGQTLDENLEEYVGCLQYSFQRHEYIDLYMKIMKTILIKGMMQDFLNTLNLLEK